MRGIKKIKSEKNAFSLAEMLLVLLIMSFLSMAIAPFVTKKVKKDTYRQPHGRFECFWLNDRLIQYNVLETGAGQQEDRTAQGYCEFEPVERAAFYLVQGVGAGGGGAFAATAPYVTSYTATYTSSNERGRSKTGYYIPCSEVSSSYSALYRACSGSIISEFTDSSGASNTSSKWAWVNEVWDDPAYTPTRTFTMCSGRGGGGTGKGGWVRQFIPVLNELGLPVVLDPVGAGASTLRTRTALEIMEKIRPDVIRGNISEIRTLWENRPGRSRENGEEQVSAGATRGVDADIKDAVTEENLEEGIAFAKAFAKEIGCIVAITGAIDLVSDGDSCYVIRNGRAQMSRITGTGCQLSGLMCAFVTANPEQKLAAAAASVCAMGLAGEIGWSRMKDGEGNATYRNRIIDAVYQMDGDTLEQGAAYEIR